MSPTSTPTVPTNDAKAAAWQAYRDRRPTRVPVLLATNPRVVLLDPDLNPDAWSFEDAWRDPELHVQVQLRHALHRATTLARFTDDAVGLPDTWTIGLDCQNVYEAALLGCPVEYRAQQIPDTHPIYATDREAIFQVDIEHPLESDFAKSRLKLWHGMDKVCQGLTFEGRPVKLAPWAVFGTDGPVTVACNLIGTEFLVELAADPDYADRLMAFLIRAALLRRDAFKAYWGDRIPLGGWLADDSIAMLSPAMYRERVLPHHRTYFDAVTPTGDRGIHLCGDATHLFPMLKQELRVMTFDTGFPVDHGALRRTLGPDVEILGGPEVALLLQGTPDRVYQRATAILQSGIMTGGRFILREGNNLPPRCPPANLAAMYQAALDHGRYPQP
jgi:uroporphyrinogen-III decarboxylase